jgi:D-alanyl-D-alanine endopeptidase (penicillin-binding protein 7)
MVFHASATARAFVVSVLTTTLLAAGCSRIEPADPAAVPAIQAAGPSPTASAAAEPVAQIEVAPPTEEGPPLLSFERGTSMGHAAGLHKVDDKLRLSASAALVIDQASGDVLVQRNEQAVLPIASLTKLMTGMIVTEARLPMEEDITITQDDVDDERHSRSRLRVGTTISRREALRVALMSSENRAAHALGRTFPGGMKEFVGRMNAKARALGMKSTTYVDPTGLSTANRSTAADLASLLRVASKNSVLAEDSTTSQYLLPVARGRKLQYNNSNRLVKNAKWDIALQKTGYIVEAGWCMVLDTRVGDRNLLMVLLDAGSSGNRLRDAERLRQLAAAQPESTRAAALNRR